MKKLLNTLYITTQGVYLRKEGETVVAELGQKVIARFPIHNLSGLVCFGAVTCSPYLLGLCAERGVHVSFLSEHGSFLARVEGKTTGNVLLRVKQVQVSLDESTSLAIASNSIIAKILNSRSVLQRFQRDHGKNEACEEAVSVLARSVEDVRKCQSLEKLRGIEGDAARRYFSVFNQLLVAQKGDFSMTCRSKHPPLDPVNSLLSFVYTLLAHECSGALQSVGLDPQIGFLHALRPGRPSLALDLEEEFRACLADRLVLSLINLKQVTVSGFRKTESGAVEMSEDTRKTVLNAWQERKREVLLHPFLKEKVEIGLLPYVQALLLARHLRGDLDAYPPYLHK